MYKLTIQARYKAGIQAEAIDAFWSLYGAFCRSGQLLGNPLVSSRRGVLVMTGVVHERSSLLPRNDSPMARKARKRFRSFLRAKPVITCEPLLEGHRTCVCP